MHGSGESSAPVISFNGKPITEELAISLRETVFGRCPDRIRSEYFTEGPGLIFRDADRELSYGISIGQTLWSPMLRSLLMTIQGHILRALMFQSRPSRVVKSSSITPDSQMQHEALATALSDIFWKTGSNTSAFVCLPHQTQSFVQTSHKFNEDGITERLVLYQFHSYEELLSFVRRNLFVFQEHPGPAILLSIYSSVLSRKIERVEDDLGYGGKKNDPFRESLISYSGKIIYSTLCLFLTGRATPFLHNGISYEGNEDRFTGAQVGITCRSPLGLLLWMGQEDKSAGFRIGSRLKTPVFPIWITIIGDCSGVLFSKNRDLMRDYHAENRFDLHYFTSSHQQLRDIALRVTTKDTEEDKRKKDRKTMYLDGSEENQQQTHPMEEIIRTKWGDATVNWNGEKPFV